MKKYYIMKGGSQLGPYSVEEMHAFNLPAETMVWYNELEVWKMLKDAPELRHLSVKPDQSKTFWYIGGAVALLLMIGVFVAFGKKEGSQEVADQLASTFAYDSMKACNATTGSDATYHVKDWECKDKRYTMDVEASWKGSTYEGNSCLHVVRCKVMVDEDGTDREFVVNETNACMEEDARGDFNVRRYLGRN
ncbi:DUF4339 domain-containing protein [Dyadobacter sp. Leaf189]|uniref:DUF4339 domain-containing protein n=1 Tax=Dyadobacter sp. Leaf189 TaxID=1736295 RepID=UPI0006F6F117|nr:DUF4339 domain-containing protein [Dyadobacter sp. Leaf189]KQS33824.1 hypothetical protein ASG33_07190 [Dyadobacter sp. Leaf189]